MNKYFNEIKKRGILYAVDPSFPRTGGHSIEQSPWELASFAQWIENNGGIGSYMEVGVSTGGTLTFIVDMFKPQRIYAADINKPKLLPNGTNFFHGNTFSKEFREWCRGLPKIDLIWIDADHKYESVVNDHEVCKQIPHKWMAFHDVCGLRNCEGSKRHWLETINGRSTDTYFQWIDPNPRTQVGIGLIINE